MREQALDRATARGDLIAGVTTAVMLVPQGMAYAMLAGLPPVVGLYASMLPLIVYGLLGTSRQLAVGPVAMISLLVASSVEQLGLTGQPEAVAIALTLAMLSGVIQLALGAVRFGFVVDFVSHPVVSGFTSAAAIIIGTSQLPQLLGIQGVTGDSVGARLVAILAATDQINLATATVSLGAVVALLSLRRWAPRVPGALLVVLSALALMKFTALSGFGVVTVGLVPAGLPPLTLPPIGQLAELLPMAALLSLVGFAESISVAKAYAKRHRYAVDPNRELLALGAANIAASLSGGYPVTGGLSRTAVNDRAGARTKRAGILTAVVVTAAALVFAPALSSLPRAVLAAIIMTAVASLFDAREARRLWRVDRADFVIWTITFIVTLTVGIEAGLGAGVCSAVFWFAYAASQPHIAVLGRMPQNRIWRNITRNSEACERPGVLVIRVDAPLYYGNVRSVRAALNRLVDARDGLHTFVLDCSPINRLDSTAAEALVVVIEELAARGVATSLATVRGPVRDQLRQFGLVPPEIQLFERVQDAVDEAVAQQHEVASKVAAIRSRAYVI